ncbi:PspA/IM30 family protein [Paenibacillus sp. NFR01]|uniref:PspA/IM30 family protein n=1 Tax=Paenibacillus sp. NFR01 TaxID=1566279 RepID=UPI0008D1D99F|nr:PspA/IM30 family protein [Paenibacillus sp. NFR01]SET91757.1 phage shock protein A (PspA) family protein [Paenibacillus sp. NFR01]
MSIFQRIATLTKAAINEGLNKLEDPILMTGQYLRDLDDKIAGAESKQRELTAAAALLERRHTDNLALAEHCEADAVTAMREGNEPAARAALEAKLRYLETAQTSLASLEQTRSTLAALEVDLAHAKAEFERLKAKRAELTERARKAAELAKQAAPQGERYGQPGAYGYPLHTGSASRGFERMENKINEWESHAEVSAKRYGSIDPAMNSAVEAELERLRQRKSE